MIFKLQRFGKEHKYYTEKEITNTDEKKGVVGTFKSVFGQWLDEYDNFICYNLERFDTLIDDGEYKYTFYASPANHLIVPLLHDVPNKSYVEVHPANWVFQLKACSAPCTTIDLNTPMGVGSKLAWAKLIGLMGKEGVIKVETI